jgi:hypothetical protein
MQTFDVEDRWPELFVQLDDVQRNSVRQSLAAGWHEGFNPTREDVEKHVNQYENATTRAGVLRYIRQLFNFAKHNDWITTSVADKVKMPRFHLPAATTVLVAHCDINRAGLHWCAGAFDQSMTCHIPAYGRYPATGFLWPDKASEQQQAAAIYRGLVAMAAQVAGIQFVRDGTPFPLSMMLVDASYKSDVVHRFAESSPHRFQVMPAIGRAAHKYRWSKDSLVGRAMEQCHIQRTKERRQRYAMANVDFWRETMQRAFLGEAGEPGGCTLYHERNKHAHRIFAEHLTAEVLENKYETDLGWRWEWTHAVGTNWDWGDALTGCWVAAALQGLSSGGVAVERKKRTASVIIGGKRYGAAGEQENGNGKDGEHGQSGQTGGQAGDGAGGIAQAAGNVEGADGLGGAVGAGAGPETAKPAAKRRVVVGRPSARW